MIPAGSGKKFAVGLTGGIGSGKSLVADEFARLGAHVVDADAIAHALTGAGGRAIEPIRARFGNEFVDADGALNRGALRSVVFRDSAARLALEQILHPMIRAEAEEQAASAPETAPYVIFVIPLLIESGVWRARVDRVLAIDCSIETQLERVMHRSRLDEAATRAIISTQATRAARLDAADDVLVNEGEPRAALQRTARLHARYLEYGQTRTGADWRGSL